jgi:hypothetical protein
LTENSFDVTDNYTTPERLVKLLKGGPVIDARRRSKENVPPDSLCSHLG